MNTVRFLDQSNNEQLGTDYRDGSAELLKGGLFINPEPTGQRVPVDLLKVIINV